MSKKIFFVILFLVSFLYLFLRLYQINIKIDFRLDQGVHLLETKTMFDSHQFRLIGPMVTSKSLNGRNFFIGANYYYVLGIIGLISQWNPLIVTIIFIFLDFFFYLFFILFLKKIFNPSFALIIFLFIAVSPYLIIHSRFFWNPHLLIPLSILTLFFLHKFILKNNFWNLFLASFFWGFAFACHYTAIFWVIFFLYILFKSKTILKIKSYLLVISGFIFGNLPFFIFEIRHQFYNLKTIFYIFTHSSQGGELTSHYFIFPLLIFIIYFLLILLSKIKSKFIAIFLLLIFLISLTVFQFKIYSGFPSFGNIVGWTYPDQQKVADLISQNCPANFNVAATMQGDTRSYDLRYLLNIKKCHPLGVEDYPSSQKIFLIAPVNRSPETETVWEISSFKPFIINRQIQLNDYLVFYELVKN